MNAKTCKHVWNGPTVSYNDGQSACISCSVCGISYFDFVNKIFPTPTYNCFYCGFPLNNSNKTLDHIIPKSKGGHGLRRNKVISCKQCNTLKSDHTLEEFKGVVLANRDRIRGVCATIISNIDKLITYRDNSLKRI